MNETNPKAHDLDLNAEVVELSTMDFKTVLEQNLDDALYQAQLILLDPRICQARVEVLAGFGRAAERVLRKLGEGRRDTGDLSSEIEAVGQFGAIVAVQENHVPPQRLAALMHDGAALKEAARRLQALPAAPLASASDDTVLLSSGAKQDTKIEQGNNPISLARLLWEGDWSGLQEGLSEHLSTLLDAIHLNGESDVLQQRLLGFLLGRLERRRAARMRNMLFDALKDFAEMHLSGAAIQLREDDLDRIFGDELEW